MVKISIVSIKYNYKNEISKIKVKVRFSSGKYSSINSKHNIKYIKWVKWCSHIEKKYIVRHSTLHNSYIPLIERLKKEVKEKEMIEIELNNVISREDKRKRCKCKEKCNEEFKQSCSMTD